jgi:DMSO/TMAO reductase YedYZ molybdopterin-dependent catalytic subunit
MRILFFLVCSTAALYAQSKQSFLTTEFSFAGNVAKPLMLNAASLEKFKMIAVPSVAVKNHKGDVIGQASGFKGVLLREILDSAKIKLSTIRDASRMIVVAKAPDGYTVVYSCHEIFNTDVGDNVYVLFQKDGKEIAGEDGGRFRMISTKDRITGLRHSKWLQTIEVVELK